MTKLLDKQCHFTLMISALVAWAYEQGYEMTYGEAYRTPEQSKINATKGIGIANSLHTQRLAIDFNLFIDGVYQISTEAYRPLGNKWKQLSPLNRWGGDFTKQDGNHFSTEHEGVQ